MRVMVRRMGLGRGTPSPAATHSATVRERRRMLSQCSGRSLSASSPPVPLAAACTSGESLMGRAAMLSNTSLKYSRGKSSPSFVPRVLRINCSFVILRATIPLCWSVFSMIMLNASTNAASALR